MVVSLNPAITFGSNSRKTPRANVKGNTAILSKNVGKQTKYVKSSFVKDAGRMVMGLAMGATALFGFSRCTPEDITLPKKVQTEDTIPKVPTAIDTTAVVVTPSVTNSPMSDPNLSPIAKDIKEAYAKLGIIDTTKAENKGALKLLDTYAVNSGYHHTFKFEYPPNDPKTAIYYDIVTDRDNPNKIDTVAQFKETWVHNDANPNIINVKDRSTLLGDKWDPSYSIYSREIQGNKFVQFVDGKPTVQLISDTPIRLNCKNIQTNLEDKINILKTALKDTMMNVSTGLTNPRAIKRIIR